MGWHKAELVMCNAQTWCGRTPPRPFGKSRVFGGDGLRSVFRSLTFVCCRPTIGWPETRIWMAWAWFWLGGWRSLPPLGLSTCFLVCVFFGLPLWIARLPLSILACCVHCPAAWSPRGPLGCPRNTIRTCFTSFLLPTQGGVTHPRSINSQAQEGSTKGRPPRSTEQRKPAPSRKTPCPPPLGNLWVTSTPSGQHKEVKATPTLSPVKDLPPAISTSLAPSQREVQGVCTEQPGAAPSPFRSVGGSSRSTHHSSGDHGSNVGALISTSPSSSSDLSSTSSSNLKTTSPSSFISSLSPTSSSLSSALSSSSPISSSSSPATFTFLSVITTHLHLFIIITIILPFIALILSVFLCVFGAGTVIPPATPVGWFWLSSVWHLCLRLLPLAAVAILTI